MVFKRVHFSECSLVVLGGAHVTLHACTFTRSTPSHAALYMHGKDTIADMRGDKVSKSTIQGGAHCAIVQQGARLKVSNVVVTGVSVTGIEVSGKGSALEVSDSFFEGFSSARSKTIDTTAVRVSSGSSATLHKVCMTGMHVGMHACLGSGVSLQSCSLKATKRSSVMIETRSWGALSGCEISESGGDAIEVCGLESSCEVNACKLLGSRLSGAVVTNKAEMILRDCESSSSKQLGGYVALNGASMTLLSCKSVVDVRGCYVKAAALVGEECIITHAEKELVCAEGGAEVGLVGCKLQQSDAEHGVVAKGQGSVVSMYACDRSVMNVSTRCVHIDGNAASKAGGRGVGSAVSSVRQGSGMATIGEVDE